MKLLKRIICLFRGHDWRWERFHGGGLDALLKLVKEEFSCLRCELPWKERM